MITDFCESRRWWIRSLKWWKRIINSNFYTLDSNHSKMTFSGEGKLRLYIKSADLKKMMPGGNLELQEQRKSSINVHSVQFSHSVVSDSLQLHEPQHTRPPCPSPTPRVHPNPCPLGLWCHPTTSSSVLPFFCPQSFPASGSFQMSQPFASGGQSIGVSASTSVLPTGFKKTRTWKQQKQ